MQKLTILVVDDEQDIQDLLSAIIVREFNYEVYTAGSVAEAIKISNKIKVDVAVLDIKLGDGLGFDIMSHLKSLNDKTAYIFVSAFSQCLEQHEKLKLDSMGFIGKPFRSKEIIDLLLETSQKIQQNA